MSETAMTGEIEALPCRWGGGNDYMACRVCHLEYDYRVAPKPPCGAAAAIARLTAELARVKAAIFGGTNFDPALPVGCFVEMAMATEAARQGALARALTAEAERDQLKIGNRVLDELVTEHCAKRLTAEAALAKAQDGATLAGLLDQADDVWTDYGSGFRIHFSFPPSHQSDVILRINRRRCRARSNGEIP